MGKINILPENVSNLIAAGEVVERPASVVKELVENSLDAGATQINISIREGGLEEILVQDNGSGMDEEDLILCFARFGTSKVSSAEDLNKIVSFGFRGEALPSIAAVADLLIKSRIAPKALGLEAKIREGRVVTTDCGMSYGTIVKVSNLFHVHPARLKFMKSQTTEMNHIMEMVQRFALSQKAGFTLNHNGREVFKVLPAHNSLDRLKEIWGEEIMNRSLEINEEGAHLKITGWIVRPEITSSSPKQFIFVNHRPIRDHYLAAAVKAGFGGLIMPRSYPYYAIFIELPPEMVDVNVHPRKEEVAFVNRSAVFEGIKRAVSNVLGGIDPTYGAGNQPFIPDNTQSFRSSSPIFTSQPLSRPTLAGLSALEFNDKTIPPREILQINKTYLVYEVEEGLRLVDQHAAAERINYEKLIRNFKENRAIKQPLLLPITLTLKMDLKKSFQVIKESLLKIGFDFDQEGSELTIKAVPEEMKNKDIAAVTLSVLNDLESGEGEFREISDISLRALTYLACRMSIKAGDELNLYEREKLIGDLADCTLPYTCPHGRPVTIELSLSELEKMFKRKI